MRQDELSQKSYCLVGHVEELSLAVWQLREHKYRIVNQSLHWMQMWKVVTRLKSRQQYFIYCNKCVYNIEVQANLDNLIKLIILSYSYL